jgi:hypothetical protein
MVTGEVEWVLFNVDEETLPLDWDTVEVGDEIVDGLLGELLLDVVEDKVLLGTVEPLVGEDDEEVATVVDNIELDDEFEDDVRRVREVVDELLDGELFELLLVDVEDVVDGEAVELEIVDVDVELLVDSVAGPI